MKAGDTFKITMVLVRPLEYEDNVKGPNNEVVHVHNHRGNLWWARYPENPDGEKILICTDGLEFQSPQS